MLEIHDMREHLWINPQHTWEDYRKRRSLSDIKLIVVHDTENNINDIKIANELEIKNTALHPMGLPRIRFHYWINEAGEVYLCNDLENVTWHSHLADKKSLAVALVGDYDKQEPKKENLKILEVLLNKLITELNLSRKNVFGHGELKLYLNFTRCPGKNLIKYVKQYRKIGRMV